MAHPFWLVNIPNAKNPNVRTIDTGRGKVQYSGCSTAQPPTSATAPKVAADRVDRPGADAEPLPETDGLAAETSGGCLRVCVDASLGSAEQHGQVIRDGKSVRPPNRRSSDLPSHTPLKRPSGLTDRRTGERDMSAQDQINQISAPDFPVPAFSIGDVVFGADVTMSHRQLPCPDCGDEKTVPAQLQHETVQIDCPRCQNISLRNDLVVREYTPSVVRLTIGSIRIDTNQDDPIEYMAVETGVGSGTIHRESTLFHDADCAHAYAQKIAQEKNADQGHPQHQRNERARQFSVLSLTDAIRREYMDRIIPVEIERDALFDCLAEIAEYSGGADSALDDEYVMERTRSLIAKVRGENE